MLHIYSNKLCGTIFKTSMRPLPEWEDRWDDMTENEMFQEHAHNRINPILEAKRERVYHYLRIIQQQYPELNEILEEYYDQSSEGDIYKFVFSSNPTIAKLPILSMLIEVQKDAEKYEEDISNRRSLEVLDKPSVDTPLINKIRQENPKLYTTMKNFIIKHPNCTKKQIVDNALLIIPNLSTQQRFDMSMYLSNAIGEWKIYIGMTLPPSPFIEPSTEPITSTGCKALDDIGKKFPMIYKIITSFIKQKPNWSPHEMNWVINESVNSVRLRHDAWPYVSKFLEDRREQIGLPPTSDEPPYQLPEIQDEGEFGMGGDWWKTE